MDKGQERAREKLERLCNAVADSIEAMTDEEVIAEAKASGENVDAIVRRVEVVIDDASAESGRRKLAEARAKYEAHRGELKGRVLDWTLERKRALLQEFAQNDNALREKLTLAARKGEDSEADVDSFIGDLIDLGVIDAEGNVK